MLQKNRIFISLCVGCVIFFASCGSTPEPESEAPVTLPSEVTEELPTQTSAVNQDTLLFSDIENKRQAAIDAGAEDYFPAQLEWLDTATNDLKIEAEQEPGKDIVSAIGKWLEENYRLLAEDSKAEQVKPERTAAMQAKERVDSIIPLEPPEEEAPYDAAAAYDEAVASFAQGDTNLNSGNLDAARSDYQSSRETFDDIFMRESEKQAAEAEAQRQAESQRQAEIQRQAQLEAAVKQAEAAAERAEAARKEAEARAAAAEAAAKLAEDNAKAIQAIEAERQAELKRIADEEAARQAELQRQAEEEAEAARLAEQQRLAEAEAARLAAEEARLRSYTVQSGDSYSRIAGELYEDQSLWPRLYEANRDKMRDPDNPHLIYPDMVIEVPNGE